MFPFRASTFLLLTAGFFLLTSSFISQKNVDTQLLIHDSPLRMDSCTVSIGEQSASLGDDIQQWINLLGPYSRCERKRTGNIVFTGRLDSVFVWDELGITLLAEEKDNWRVGEVLIFLMNEHTKGVDTAKLHYFGKAAEFRDIYASTPNYIEHWSKSFGRNDEEAIRENRTLLTEQHNGNLSLPTLYPRKTFSEDFILAGSPVNPSWQVKKINKNRRARNLPLLAFLMRLDTQKEKNLRLNLTKKPWISDKDYLTTHKTLEGIYGMYDQKHRFPMARTTNGGIEFFVIKGMDRCMEE